MASICHLSCCHFPRIGPLTSDTESMSDVIIVVKSFPSDIMWAEVVIHLAVPLISLSDLLYG